MVNMMKNLLPVPQVQHTAMEKLQISKVSRFVVFKNLVSKTFKALPIRARHKMLPKKMNFTLLSSFRRRQVAQKAFLVTGLLLLTLCCDRLLVFGSQLAVLCIYALLDKSLPAKEKGSSYSRRCDLVFWWQHLSTFWGLKLLLLINRIKTFSAALEASLACMCHWVLLKWEQQKIQICMQRTALKLLHFHCVHCVHCVLHPGLTNVPQLFLHMQLQLPPPHSLNLGFDNPNQEIDLE